MKRAVLLLVILILLALAIMPVVGGAVTDWRDAAHLAYLEAHYSAPLLYAKPSPTGAGR